MQNLSATICLGEFDFQNEEGLLTYNCKATLPISKKQVEIFFETDSSANLPTYNQKQFLNKIINNFDNVLIAISIELSGDGKSNITKKKEIDENYDLITIGIPLNVIDNIFWDLSMENKRNKSTALLANFDGMKPIKVWIENYKTPFFTRLILKILGQK